MGVLSAVKKLARSTLLKEGRTAVIIWGPSRGLKYRVFDDYGLQPILGRQEPHVQKELKARLSKGQVAWDVGANHGLLTLLMARAVGPKGHVLALEPLADLCKRIEENAGLNGFRNITVLNRAVAEIDGNLQFEEGDSSATGRLSPTTRSSPPKTAVPIRSSTLDALMSEVQMRPALIKIDVEGAESRVLTGGANVLSQVGPDLLIELHNPDEDRAVGRLLEHHQYAAFRCGTSQRVDLSSTWPDPAGIWGHVMATKQKT